MNKILGSINLPISVTHVQGGVACANGTHYFVDGAASCFCGQIASTTLNGLRIEPAPKEPQR